MRMSLTTLLALRRLMLGLLVPLLVLSAAGCKSDSKETTEPGAPRTFDSTAVPAPRAAGTTTPEDAQAGVAEPQFPAPKDDAQLVRLVIPAANINAPLQVKGVNSRNEMENPDGKDNVAWYNFTAKPGLGSNAVFSGHVDWFTGERGVFWGLRDLKEGDEVDVKHSDGMELKYKVVDNKI